MEYTLVGYVNQLGRSGEVMALYGRQNTPNHYEYLVPHHAHPLKKIPLNTSQPLKDRQLIKLDTYKNPFYVNLYAAHQPNIDRC
jgi:hypothetical protein